MRDLFRKLKSWFVLDDPCNDSIDSLAVQAVAPHATRYTPMEMTSVCFHQSAVRHLRMIEPCTKCRYFAGGLLVCAPHPYGVDPGCSECPDFEERYQ